MGKGFNEFISIALAKQNQLLPGLLNLANWSVEHLPQMTALPPPGEAPYPYGDIVPLSFLLLALESGPNPIQDTQAQQTITHLKQIFQRHKHDSLWAFQSNALITSVDSAFVLRAVGEVDGILALEQFSDGAGGYYPQLFTEGRQKNRMTIDSRTAHWCQADYSILCQVEALKRRAGLTSLNNNPHLEQGFSTRSGLFIANPYLMDWLLADAIGTTTRYSAMAKTLATEVLTSLTDSSGGCQFDRTFSIALALSSLARLNCWSEQADDAFIELMDYWPDGIPACIPFYSTMHIPWRGQGFWEIAALKLDDTAGQLINVGGQQHRITFYQDTHRLISQAIVFTALAELITYFQKSDRPASIQLNETPHPRYQCSRHADYIAQYALPPYVTHQSNVYV